VKRAIRLAWPALALVFAACGGDDESTESPPKPTETIDLQVDTNRDGVVDVNDAAGEELWTPQAGAVFLANYDDDNLDHIRDSDDNWVNLIWDPGGMIVNGDDGADLARIAVAPWAEVPGGAFGQISVDPASQPHIRLFKAFPDGNFALVMDSDTPCDTPDAVCDPIVGLSTDEVKNGVQLAIEAKRIPGTSWVPPGQPTAQTLTWNGIVELRLGVFKQGSTTPIITETNPTGFDVVQLRVAPWIMVGNLTPSIDNVFFSNSSPVFVNGMQTAMDDAGVQTSPVTNWPDQWTEDWMILGYTSMPGPNGTSQSIKLAYPRPWGRQNVDSALPVNWLAQTFTSPGQGYAVLYNVPHSGDSFDSGGNHDLIPAYENPANGQSYPYGRIVHGTGVIDETEAFYEANLVQAPRLVLDTGWLIVGHVDEIFSYAPASTERGWKLMIGAPDLAVTMMTAWQAQGHGAEEMFVGKQWSDNTQAAISIDDALADPDLMAWSQQGQAKIDQNVTLTRMEVGLTDDEIIEVPFLFEQDFGAKVAYNPGTVNVRLNGNHVVFPDPFGPSINGTDGFRQDIIDRFGNGSNQLGVDGQGLDVFFADDWDLYHALLGEVHCGSNQIAFGVPETKWWEAAQ
jgi:protein-arginine deiminase